MSKKLLSIPVKISHYRPEVDGLRAIAVIGVLIYHAVPGILPGGFTGVDIFFVISGYLISKLLIHDIDAGKFNVIDFYKRRIRRLFPALILVILTTWIFGLLLFMPNELKSLGDAMINASYFFSNFQLVNEAGYFDVDANLKPLQHLWSLAVEEQFYIVWPWFLVLVWRWKFIRNYRNYIVLTIILISLYITLNTKIDNSVARFFLPQYRAWQILSGAMLAMNEKWIREILLRRCWGKYIALCGLIIIIFSYIHIKGGTDYPEFIAVLPVMGALFVIAAPSSLGMSKKLLATRPFVEFGIISYPIYLWHWPLFSMARILFGSPSSYLLVFLAVLSIVLAWATFYWVESPIKSGQSVNLESNKFYYLCLIGLLALGGIGDFTRNHNGFPARVDGNFWSQIAWPRDMVYSKQCLGGFKFPGSFCQINSSAPIDSVLIGDSHANHFFFGLSKKLMTNHEGLIEISGPLYLKDITQNNVKFILRNKFIKNVFIAYYFGRINQRDNPFGQVMNSMIYSFIKYNKNVIVIIDSPGFDVDPSLCTNRPWLARMFESGQRTRRNCSESIAYMNKKRRLYTEFLNKISVMYPKVKFIDAYTPFCKNQRCEPMMNGSLLFRDRHHLTTFGSDFSFNNVDISRLLTL